MANDDTLEDLEIDPGQTLTDLDPDMLAKINAISAINRSRADLYDLPSVSDIDTDWTDLDRTRGVFTERDREYLRYPLRFEGQASRDVRYRIRQRLANLYYDATYFDSVRLSDMASTFDSIGPASPYLALSLFRFAALSLRIAVSREAEFRDEFYERSTEDAIKTAESMIENQEYGDSDRSTEDFDYILVSTSAEIDVEKQVFNGEPLREKILDGNATQKEFEDYWKNGSQWRLVREALAQEMSTIEVKDSVGMTATYSVEELADELGIEDSPMTDQEYEEGYMTVREYLDILAHDAPDES